MKRDEVMQAALNAGFMISNQYGQGKNKLMPVSDVDTLVKFAKMVNAPMLEALKAGLWMVESCEGTSDENDKVIDAYRAVITAAEKE